MSMSAQNLDNKFYQFNDTIMNCNLNQSFPSSAIYRESLTAEYAKISLSIQSLANYLQENQICNQELEEVFGLSDSNDSNITHEATSQMEYQQYETSEIVSEHYQFPMLFEELDSNSLWSSSSLSSYGETLYTQTPVIEAIKETNQKPKKIKRKPAAQKNYTCENCKISFWNTKQLERHLNTKSHLRVLSRAKTVVKCEIENPEYLNENSVQMDNLAKCLRCNKEFQKVEHLRQHINVFHSNVKPYRCDTCGFRFLTKEFLQVHMEKHRVKDRRYQCGQCQKQFTDNLNYKNHICDEEFDPNELLNMNCISQSRIL